MEIIHCDESHRQIWDEYVKRVDNSCVYHLLGWKNVIEKSFGHKTFYLMVKDNGNIRGILPIVMQKSRLFGKFLTSLPFFNYGGICADSQLANMLLLNEAIKIAQIERAQHIELRHFMVNGFSLPTKKSKVSMVLELKSNPEELWKELKAKVRNQVRKAGKSNLTISLEDKEGLGNFYRIFAVNMRNLGTPVYSKHFFSNILETFPDNTKIFSVYLGNKVIASSLTIGFKDALEVPWASSLRKYQKLCPNNLLYWKMIEYACQKGYEKFDFGRSSWDSGTFKFKEHWGAKPRQLYWQYWLKNGDELPEVNPSNPKYKVAIRIWQKLPLFLTNYLGPKIVKNLP